MFDFNVLKLIDDLRAAPHATDALECVRESAPSEALAVLMTAFANQPEGGVMVFGVQTEGGFQSPGVQAPALLMERLEKAASTVEPPLKLLFTQAVRDGRTFVTAQVPGHGIHDPLFYCREAGPDHGVYVRRQAETVLIGPVARHSREAFLAGRRDEKRAADGPASLDRHLTDILVRAFPLPPHRPVLYPPEQIAEWYGLTTGGVTTMTGLLVAGDNPQACYPDLCVLATVTDANAVVREERLNGTVPEMLRKAERFARHHAGALPADVLHEALLNALLHRDYSALTENEPVRLDCTPDGVTVTSPGGLFGTDGKGLRNPALRIALETLGEVNLFAGFGLQRMRSGMRNAGLPAPVCTDTGEAFKVMLRTH